MRSTVEPAESGHRDGWRGYEEWRPLLGERVGRGQYFRLFLEK